MQREYTTTFLGITAEDIEVRKRMQSNLIFIKQLMIGLHDHSLSFRSSTSISSFH
jgi:hypothetical protein